MALPVEPAIAIDILEVQFAAFDQRFEPYQLMLGSSFRNAYQDKRGTNRHGRPD